VRNTSFGEQLEVPFFQFGIRSINKISHDTSVVWLDYKDVCNCISALDHEKVVSLVDESSSLFNMLSLEDNSSSLAPQSSYFENDMNQNCSKELTTWRIRNGEGQRDRIEEGQRDRIEEGQRDRIEEGQRDRNRYGGAPYLLLRNRKTRRVRFMCATCNDCFPTRDKMRKHAVDIHEEGQLSKRVLCPNGAHVIRLQHYNTHRCGKYKSENMCEWLRNKGFIALK